MYAKPGTRLGSEPRTAPPHPPPHAHTLTQAHTRHRKASNDASSSTRRGCRTRRSRTGSRCRRNAGESRLPRSSSLLCACRQHAGSQHWSHPGGAGAIACASCVIGRDKNARGRARERMWGKVWQFGMGWAAYRKSLIFRCPISFNQLTNPSKLHCLQRPGSPISSWSENVLGELGGTP
jgi:hypothetical protein